MVQASGGDLVMCMGPATATIKKPKAHSRLGTTWHKSRVKRIRRDPLGRGSTPPASAKSARATQDLTPATRGSKKRKCNGGKVLIWNCSELKVKSVRKVVRMFAGKKEKSFTVKRVIQPNGTRRFDCLPVGNSEVRSANWPRTEEALLARIRPSVPPQARGPTWKEAPHKQLASGQILSVWTLNINGFERKRTELLAILGEKSPTILCLQETNRALGSRPKIPRYQVIESFKNGASGNGLILGVCRDSGLTLSEFEATPWFLAGRAEGKTKEGLRVGILAYSVYIPCRNTPNRSKALDLLRRSVVKAWVKGDIHQVILSGDLNSTEAEVTKYLDSLGIGLVAVPCEGPTRVSGNSKSKLDYVAITGFGGCDCSAEALRYVDISDHFPVVAKWCWRDHPVYEPKPKIDPRILSDMGLTVSGDYRWAQLVGITDAEKVAMLLKETAWEVAKAAKAVKTPCLPKWDKFISRDSLEIIRERRKVFALKGTDEFDEEVYKRLWAESKKSLALDAEKARAARLRDLCTAWMENRSKDLWRQLNCLCTDSRDGGLSGPLMDKVNGGLVHTDKEKEVVWAQHFEGLAKDVSGNSRSLSYWESLLPDVEVIPVRDGCDDPLTWGEITAALKATPRGKAAGIDGIPGELYKLVQDEPNPTSKLATAIDSFVSLLWNTATVPSSMTAAVVVPVPKKGDLSDPDNYRGISLIPTAMKIISKIATGRLNQILERDEVLIREQAGFRSMEECVGQATALYELVKRRMNQSKDTFALFIDFAKAYDKVPHEGMLRKLRAAGIGGQLYSVIRGLYENPTMCVRSGSGLSKQVEYSCGVRQGCPASPILFDVYINDILDNIKGVPVPGLMDNVRGLLFADDAVVFADNLSQLEESATSLYCWAQKWEMKINVRKCGVLLFSEKEYDQANEPTVMLGGEPVPCVSSYTYLGVTLDRKLSRESMVAGIAAKGRKTLEGLRKMLVNRKIPAYLKLLLYRVKLLPVLTYGAEIWGMNSAVAKPLQRIADSALRLIVRGSKSTSLGRLREELGVAGIDSEAAVKRCRALGKFPSLRTWISVLMKQVPRSRKSSWVTGGERWLKTFAEGDMAGGPSAKRRLMEVFTMRASKKDRTKATAWATELGIRDGVPAWISLGVRHPELSISLVEIGRMRLGIFPTGSRLACLQAISDRFRQWCPFCEIPTPETLEHLLIECPRWETLRGKHLDPQLLAEGRQSSAAASRAVGVLLGGEPLGTDSDTVAVGTCKDRTAGRVNNPNDGGAGEEMVLSTARFLAELVPLRRGLLGPKLSGHTRRMSSWNQGHEGTVALEGL